MTELFRFAVQRAPESVDPSVPLPLDSNSPFQARLATLLQQVRPRERVTGTARAAAMAPVIGIARDFLMSAYFVSTLSELNYGKLLQTLLKSFQNAAPATLADFEGRVSQVLGAPVAVLARDQDLAQDDARARDSLVAAYLAPEGHSVDMGPIADAVRVVDLIRRAAAGDASLKADGAIPRALARMLVLPVKAFPKDPNLIESVGCADLLVVRQHIKDYSLGEIQNIENILKGESRRKTLHHTLSTEKTATTEVSTTTETTQEQTTTERFDLKNEIDKTLKEDLAIKAGASVDYHGGTVDASVNFGLDYSTSKTDSQKIATDYAKEVTSRAATKVVQATKQQLIEKFTDTIETVEDHSFDDTREGAANVSGVYQWLDKVYAAQIFNYGKRTLYDLIVPEPAAQWLEAFQIKPADPSAPEPPPTFAVDFSAITPSTYQQLAQTYRAEGVPAPPVTDQTVAATLTSGGSSDQKPGDQPSTIKIPDAYEAKYAWIYGNYDWTDSKANYVGIYLGDTGVVLGQNDGPQIVNFTVPATGEVPCGVHAYQVSNYAVTIRAFCVPSQDAVDKWEAVVFDKLLTGWSKWKSDYQDALASQAQNAAAQPDPKLGGNPDENRSVERTELKRNVLQMMIGDVSQSLVEPPAPTAGKPSWPHPAMPAAVQQGELIRFFEFAFEWEHMSYVYYPYFWGRRDPFWSDKLRLHSDDTEFQDFLRAGAARVVLPVRPGFADALVYYFTTGLPWSGGGPPQVTDSNYVPIAEEIRELSGVAGAETPYGPQWEIILPTDLIRLRADGKLPVWTQPDPNKWAWISDDGSAAP